MARNILLIASMVFLIVACADDSEETQCDELATLTGTISGEEGALDEVIVTVETVTPLTGLTGDDGSFTIGAIPPGTYAVTVTVPGYEGVRFPSVTFPCGGTIDLGKVVIKKESGFMYGVVQLEGAGTNGGVVVSAEAWSSARIWISVSNEYGSWRIDDLPAGMYDVYASKVDYETSEAIEVEVVGGESVEVPWITLVPLDAVVRINVGEMYTNDRDVVLDVYAFSNVTEMILSEDSEFTSAEWQPLNVQVQFVLSEGDGVKTVYAKFKDVHGSESSVFSASIVLDTTAPEISSIEVEGADCISEPVVEVTLSAVDNYSGVESMRLSVGDALDDVPWQPYLVSAFLTLGEEDGEQRVLAQFRDRAGNESEIVEDTVLLDTLPPENAQVEVEGGADTVEDRIVILSLTADGATEMQVSNQSDMADAFWQPFSRNIVWILSEGAGPKAVYSKFGDCAGNESSIVSASITLVQ